MHISLDQKSESRQELLQPHTRTDQSDWGLIPLRYWKHRVPICVNCREPAPCLKTGLWGGAPQLSKDVGKLQLLPRVLACSRLLTRAVKRDPDNCIIRHRATCRWLWDWIFDVPQSDYGKKSKHQSKTWFWLYC